MDAGGTEFAYRIERVVVEPEHAMSATIAFE
jgi:hypothetical protein